MTVRAATILLVRHGHGDHVGNWLAGRLPGVHLDDTGRQQARELVPRLRQFPVRALYSSPLERAIETAEPASAALELPISIEVDLTEVDFGAWAGKRFAEMDPVEGWHLFNAFRGGRRPPGGELMIDVQARIVRKLAELADRHAGETIAAFSHADVIKAAIVFHLGMSVELLGRIEISPASITALHLGPHGPQIAALNLT
jgi:broad specificity phosphatase PhoE